jgi:hypothetical protein
MREEVSGGSLRIYRGPQQAPVLRLLGWLRLGKASASCKCNVVVCGFSRGALVISRMRNTNKARG